MPGEDDASLSHTIEAALWELLEQGRDGATVCPSEVARRVRPEDWRPLMGDVRQVAGRLVNDGRLEVLRRGQRVDPDSAQGPIRLRGTGARS